MGCGSFHSTDYQKSVNILKQTGKTFARSATVARTGNFSDIADALNPRKLKNSMRESCFATGFNDALPIIVSIDGTGSMEQIPYHVQKELPKLLDLLVDQGVADHPNVLFMCHDDEHAIPPDAVFQMSQFEIESSKLIESLNELIIPGYGGGNQGEAYHLPFYAAAYHTRLESFERDGTKGFFFMICDEEPYYEAGDPEKRGTSPSIAKEVFGDIREKEVTMLESLKEVVKRYHVFIIRPGHTCHGKNKSITHMWQKLLFAAGENTEHVLEVEDTNAIITTMAMAIGRLAGVAPDDLVDVLTAKGAVGIKEAIASTKNLVVANGGALVSGTTTTAIQTTDGKKTTGRRRS